MNAARPGMQLQLGSAAVNRAAQFFAIDRALDSDGEVGADRSGTGTGHQVELCILGQTDANAAGAGIQIPVASLLSLRLDVAAAGAGLQLARDVLQADAAGASFKVSVAFDDCCCCR